MEGARRDGSPRRSGVALSIEPTAAVFEHFENQARACETLGSPFNAKLIRWMASKLGDGSSVAKKIRNWPTDPKQDALALRFSGAIHALMLSDRMEPLLNLGDEALDRALDVGLLEQSRFIESFLDHPPQTNEVARASVLMPGFQEIWALDRKPLRLLEIGASAGLNHYWPLWRYETENWQWGPNKAPITLSPSWRGAAPKLGDIQISSSSGVDIRPIDLQDEAARLRLRAYIWPDQHDRLARLDAAIEQALTAPPQLTCMDAGDWLEQQLEHPVDGVRTTVFHSIVWQYLPATTKEKTCSAMERAALKGMRLAWLRMEPAVDSRCAELRLKLWPEDLDLHLANCHFHGAWVEWLA